MKCAEQIKTCRHTAYHQLPKMEKGEIGERMLKGVRFSSGGDETVLDLGNGDNYTIL